MPVASKRACVDLREKHQVEDEIRCLQALSQRATMQVMPFNDYGSGYVSQSRKLSLIRRGYAVQSYGPGPSCVLLTITDEGRTALKELLNEKR